MIKLDIKKLRIAQARACLSVNELAELAGISRVGLSKIINGERTAAAKTIGLMAKALKIDVMELLIDEE